MLEAERKVIVGVELVDPEGPVHIGGSGGAADGTDVLARVVGEEGGEGLGNGFAVCGGAKGQSSVGGRMEEKKDGGMEGLEWRGRGRWWCRFDVKEKEWYWKGLLGVLAEVHGAGGEVLNGE